jgi:hypothetical protein
LAAPVGSPPVLAIQKVEGSSPFVRFEEVPPRCASSFRTNAAPPIHLANERGEAALVPHGSLSEQRASVERREVLRELWITAVSGSTNGRANFTQPHDFGGSGVRHRYEASKGGQMITLGVICLILGLIFGIPILWTIGIILVVVGVILALLGMMGRASGPRSHYD